VRPGTYFNPQTEIVVIVDDSTSIDQEIFNMEAYEGSDWVRISDDLPVDEDSLDAALEEFQTHYHGGTAGAVSATALDPGDDTDTDAELLLLSTRDPDATTEQAENFWPED